MRAMGCLSHGGKQTLLRINKRGNPYLRRLFVQGARTVLQFRDKQSPGLSAWLAQLTSRTHYNVAGVLWQISWHAWHGQFSPTVTSIGLPYWTAVAQPVWTADDAWLKPGLEVASAIPESTVQRPLNFLIFLPGLLANNELLQRSNPAISLLCVKIAGKGVGCFL
jgi:hypothetical protein